jgi:hypothetical protein
MTSRKKPGVAFWGTVALVVVYPLSFGPACWLCEKQYVPTYVAWMFFRPLTWLVVESPHGVGEPIRKYAAIFSERDKIGLPRSGIRKISRNRPFWGGSPIDYEMDDQSRQDIISLP